MIEILALWAFLLASCTLLGDVVCRLAGLRPWSWLSGAIGVCVLLALAATGSSLPGGAQTAAVVIVLSTAAAAGWTAWTARANALTLLRRALDPALLALGVLMATLIPFFANGRVGMLGPSFNNDSRFHLWAAEFLVSGRAIPADVLGGGYPLGPHDLVAALSAGLGTSVEAGFVALLMVIPVLTAFAARALLTDLARAWGLLVALLTALTHLLASYYAQGAFKETLQTLFVLALAIAVRELIVERRFGPRAAPIPALIVGASLLTYSYPGLAWPATALGLTALGLLVAHRRTLRRMGARRALRVALPTLGVLVAVLLVAIGPQFGRLVDFFGQLSLSPSASGAITATNIGNLSGPLSPYQALGAWFSEDFRVAPRNVFYAGAMTALALGVTLYGAVWWSRRRELAIIAGAVASGLVYVVLREGESPYLAAKALVILSPFPVLLGGRALFERTEKPALELRAVRVAVTASFVCAIAWSSFLALRNAQVNPHAHQRELASMMALLAGRDVLFLAHDDFVGWRLFGAEVTNPPVQKRVGFQLRKPFVDGQTPQDFDSVTTETLDLYDYVVTSRTAYASRPPSNFELAKRTASYEAYRRIGDTPPSVLLAESTGPGAVLDCARAPDRRLARGGGRALVRPAPTLVRAPPGVGARSTINAALKLPSAGRWELSIQYASPQVLTVSTDTGQSWRLPPNLDRLGPYWRAGEVTTSGPQTLRLGLTMTRAAPSLLTAISQFAPLGRIAAVRTDRPARWIPLREACGRYVDRYVLRRAR